MNIVLEGAERKILFGGYEVSKQGKTVGFETGQGVLGICRDVMACNKVEKY